MKNNLGTVKKRHDEYPTVSVLMTVFNERPSFLESSIQSILDQTFPYFEFVILDDGSDNEETIKTLNRFANHDSRIRLWIEPHRERTKILNVGLARCRGEIVCLQRSDDWSDASRLAKQVQFLKQYPDIGLVGSSAINHREDGTPLWGDERPTTSSEVAEAFPKMNPFVHGSMCFRRKEAEAIGGYREELLRSQDYDFCWRLFERAGGCNLPEYLYHYRYNCDFVSLQRTLEQIKCHLIIKHLGNMRRMGQTDDFETARREIERRLSHQILYSECFLKQAGRLLLAGHHTKAFLGYVRGVFANPLSLRVWMKLLRWPVFVFCPPIRHMLFSDTGRIWGAIYRWIRTRTEVS